MTAIAPNKLQSFFMEFSLLSAVADVGLPPFLTLMTGFVTPFFAGDFVSPFEHGSLGFLRIPGMANGMGFPPFVN
jgi:hypothetical protein